MKYFLIAIFVILAFLTSKAQNATATLRHYNMFPGVVSIPITVSGFNNITSVTLHFTFDSTALTYTGFQNSALSNIITGCTPVHNSTSKKFSLAWQTIGTPQTVNGTLIQINFSYAGGQSDLNFNHLENEVTNQIFEPINVTWNNGSVAAPASVSIPALNNHVPGSILVPVNVNYSGVHTGVTQFSFTIDFDPQILDINGFQNEVLSGIQISEPSPGILIVSRNGSSTQLNGKLLDLDFDYTGGNTGLEFNETQCTILSGDGIAVATNYSNGAVQGVPVSLVLSTITASPEQLNICQQSIISVQLKNNLGEDILVSAGTVTLETTLGTLSQVTDNQNGSYSATLSVPNPYESGTAVITGKLNGDDFSDDTSIELLAEPFLTVPELVQTVNDSGFCGALIELSGSTGGYPSPALTYHLGETLIESPYFFPVGTTTVVATASWNCGVLSQSYTVNILDTEAPVTPENELVNVNCLSEVIEPEPPLASDNCNGLIQGELQEIIFSPEPLVCEGLVTYNYTFTDTAGNTSIWSYTWNVLPTTGPILIGTETNCATLDNNNLTWYLSEAESFDPTTLENQVAELYHDNCGGTVSASLENTIADPNNSDESYTFIYEFKISDRCGNLTFCEIHYSGRFVPDEIEITGLTIEDTRCYNATNSIIVQELTIDKPGNLTLISGLNIHFLPAVSVQGGGWLHAYISNTYCVNPTPLLAALEAENTEEVFRDSFIDTQSFFKVYPNPNTGSFNLTLTSSDIQRYFVVEIYGMTGSKIYSGRYNESGSYEIDITSYPRGIYVVRIFNGKQTGTEKIIKQ